MSKQQTYGTLFDFLREIGTREFVDSLAKGDSNQHGDRPSLPPEPDQRSVFIPSREAGLWFGAFAAQPSKLRDCDPVFQEMIASVQVPDLKTTGESR